MKKFVIVLAAAITASTSFAQDKAQTKDQAAGQLTNQKDKISYAIGLDIGFTFKKQNMDLSPDTLMLGVKDALSGKQPLLSEQQVREVMTAFQKDMEDKQTAKGKEAASVGEKFLADNKSKPDVKTTASGLQYKVIKDGTGPTPKETDTVEVNYRGTLTDGTEFDSSYKRGEPASFPVNRVIKGWTEALQLMKVGSKYQLFIPAALAYGERGAGAQIPANSALIFEVELLSIKPAAAADGAKPAAATPTPTAK